MPQFKAPVRDMRFVINEVLESEKLYQTLPGCEEATEDMINAIVEEGARFAEGVLAPLYQSGDEEGCTWSEEGVKTPAGYADAYRQYVENGWPALSAPVEHGGQGMPNLLGIVMNELAGTANWSWLMYPGLSHGAVHTVEAHGDDKQKEHYLTRLISGEWTGTMCLTEPHCGSDLGTLRTKAEPNADGTYAITGTKIFISAGEHDMAENIVHIVLARLPDAPEGTAGISLFIVPKFLVNDDGSVGERNAVHCASIEEKMGIHGNATCVLNFDGATGYLIAEPNRGLNAMFTFMNTARIGTAIQGLAHTERSYQGALEYAKERLAMRSLTGPKNPDGPADPIIVHPDVRRMLLTQKAFAEGSRAFLYYLAQLGDIVQRGDEEQAQRADDLMALLTPIGKAFVTEVGYESANLGVQVYGGHGFIKEWGMEQIVRDTRIATLYEGTTGIQALDLLGRKVLLGKMKTLKSFTLEVLKYCKDYGVISGNPHKKEMNKFIWPLFRYTTNWQQYSVRLAMRARKNFDVVSAASVDYLMYSGYVSMAFMWAQMAQTAYEKLAAGTDNPEFYKAKIQTAEFYFDRLLPRAKAHAECMMASPGSLMKMQEDKFAFLD